MPKHLYVIACEGPDGTASHAHAFARHGDLSLAEVAWLCAIRQHRDAGCCEDPATCQGVHDEYRHLLATSAPFPLVFTRQSFDTEPFDDVVPRPALLNAVFVTTSDTDPVATCYSLPWENAGQQFRLDLEHHGEGYTGDYDPANPDDQRLYRYTLSRRESAAWSEIVSHCTLLPLGISEEQIEQALRLLQRYVEIALQGPERCDRQLLQRLSWIDPTWLPDHEPRAWLLKKEDY